MKNQLSTICSYCHRHVEMPFKADHLEACDGSGDCDIGVVDPDEQNDENRARHRGKIKREDSE